MQPSSLRPFVLAAALAGATACFPFHGPGDVKRDLQSVTGRDYDRSFALTVGRTGMVLARWAVRMSDEGIPLAGIRKVEIGVYTVDGQPSGDAPASPLEPELWPEWLPLVTVHHDEEVEVMILSQGEGAALRRLLVLVEDRDELVIVRVSGRLEQVLEEAVRYALQEASHPELAEPALEEMRHASGAGSNGPGEARAAALPESPGR